MKFSALVFQHGMMGATHSPAAPRHAKQWFFNNNSSCQWFLAAAFLGVLLVAEPSNARLNKQSPSTSEASFFESGEYDTVPQAPSEGNAPAFWEGSFTDEEEARIIRNMNDANLHQKLELMAKFPEIKVEELFASSDYGSVPVEETAYGELAPVDREQEFFADYTYEPRVSEEYYLNQEYPSQESVTQENPAQEYLIPEYPIQEYSIQEYPAQEYPPQKYPPQDYPPQEYPPQEYSAQEYPPQEYSAQENPAQEYPAQEYLAQEYSAQEYPAQTNPTGYPAQEYPIGYPAQQYLEEYPAQTYPPVYDNPTFYPAADPYSREGETRYGRMLLPSDAETSSRRLPKSTVLAELPQGKERHSTSESANATEKRSDAAESFLHIETSPSSNSAKIAADSDFNDLIQESVSPDLIKQFSSSIREGGIEGRVVSPQRTDVKFATPTALQEAVHRLLRKAEDAVHHFSDSSLRETFQRVAQMQGSLSEASPLSTRLSAWKTGSPWIEFLSKALEAGCPSGWPSTTELDKVGDPQNLAVFPKCFIKYIEELVTEQKQHMGKLVRAELQNLKGIKQVFDPQEGICTLVAAALPQLFVTGFCEELRDVLVSTAYFIPLATRGQEIEVEEYGKAFSMVELTAASTVRLQLQAKLTVLEMYRFWALSPLLEEAKHLLRVWVNDPVHKWRYAIGLYQWVTAFGLWVGEVATSLEAPLGTQ